MSLDHIPQIGNRETSTAPTSAARNFYLAYLNSPDWRRTRNAALRRAKWQCSRCPSRRNLEVHHRSYERLGREFDADLEVLCPDCHRGHHIDTADDSFRVYLRLASSVLERGAWDSIAELAGALKDECAKLKLTYDTGQADRALNLVVGKRLRIVTPGKAPEPYAIGELADHVITKAEAYELVARLLQDGKSRLVKTMPAVEKTAAEQAEHESKIAQQIADVRRELSPPIRRLLSERLEAIFAGDSL